MMTKCGLRENEDIESEFGSFVDKNDNFTGVVEVKRYTIDREEYMRRYKV